MDHRSTLALPDTLRRTLRDSRWLVCLAPSLLSACKLTYSMEEFDALARKTEARTILLDEELSLYSPYDWIRTRDYADLFRRQRAEVFALFGIEHAAPTLVQLHLNPGLGVKLYAEGNRIGVHSVSTEPHGGFGGRAPGNQVILEVDPPQVLQLEDGRSIPGAFNATMFERTIRHELTHVAVFLLGVEQGGWLHEGLAHAVAETPAENGNLRPEPSHELLRWAASLPHEYRSLKWLLDWRQGIPPTDEDQKARALACALVLFLVERDGAPSLREGFPRLAALERDAILALQAEWSTWLERFAAPPAADPAVPGSSRSGQ